MQMEAVEEEEGVGTGVVVDREHIKKPMRRQQQKEIPVLAISQSQTRLSIH
ncbi:hypothetical protein Hanom_Chr03g00274671 [Helianthus anomalus]